jgi:hypothetical protein
MCSRASAAEDPFHTLDIEGGAGFAGCRAYAGGSPGRCLVDCGEHGGSRSAIALCRQHKSLITSHAPFLRAGADSLRQYVWRCKISGGLAIPDVADKSVEKPP